MIDLVEKKQEEEPLIVLSPQNNLNDDKYIQYKGYLDHALNSDESVNINNIALTGKYGSGKSSLIDSYLKDKNNYMRVSFATFTEAKKSPENEDSLTAKQRKTDIMASIINQIIYQIEPRQISLTRFRSKKPIGWILKTVIIAEFIALVAMSGMIFKLSLPYFRYTCLLAISMGAYLIYHALTKFELSQFKISVKPLETQINMSSDDLFEKYTDEILYLFQNSKKNLLIIEDLDRFNDLEIFEKLRELNTKLNFQYSLESTKPSLLRWIKGALPLKHPKHWQFVYLIKDELFQDKNDRVKFFDLILPIVPFITTNNSIDKLNDHFPQNSRRLLQILSAYIDDYRLLANIKNEYKVYFGVTRPEDKDELLALIAYKNLRPSDFDDFQNNKGLLANIIKVYKQKIDDRWHKLDNQIDQLKKNRDSTLLSREADYLFVYAKRSLGDETIHYVTEDNQRYLDINSISTAEAIVENDLKIGPLNSAVSYSKFKENTPKYAEKIKAITVYDEEIKKLEAQKKELLNYPLTAIDVEDYTNSKKNGENGETVVEQSEALELLFALIKNGYITLNYLNVINHYYGDSTTKEFLRNLYSKRNDLNIEMQLNSIDELYDKLENSDYQEPQILNLQLAKWIFDRTSDWFQKSDRTQSYDFHEQQLSVKQYDKHFIQIVETAGSKNVLFLEELIKNKPATLVRVIEYVPGAVFDLVNILGSNNLGKNEIKLLMLGNHYRADDTASIRALAEEVTVTWKRDLWEKEEKKEVFNSPVIYPEFKRAVASIPVQGTKFNLSEISDESLWKNLLSHDFIWATTESINRYFLKNGLDKAIVSFINSQELIMSATLDADFYSQILTNSEISFDKFEEFWTKTEVYSPIHPEIDNFDKISPDKIELILEMQDFNIDSSLLEQIMEKDVLLPEKYITGKLKSQIVEDGTPLSRPLLKQLIEIPDKNNDLLISRNLRDDDTLVTIFGYLDSSNISDKGKLMEMTSLNWDFKNYRFINTEPVRNYLTWFITKRQIGMFWETKNGKLGIAKTSEKK
ncbi:YobI family P-loop NTPase [Lacticaseibacillus saniviri]